MSGDVGARLGARISRHSTRNPNGALPSAGAVVLGLAALPFGIAEWNDAVEAAGNRAAPVLVGVPAVLVITGTIAFVLALLHKDEEFVLHERGLLRRRGETTTTVAWEEITGVVDSRPLTLSRWQRRLGYEVWCIVWSRNGTLLITGHTEGAAELALTIRAEYEARRRASRGPAPPRRPVRGTFLAVPGLALVFMGSLVTDDPETASIGTVCLLSGAWCFGRGLRRLNPWRNPRPGAGRGWTRNAWAAALLSVWALVLDALGLGAAVSTGLWAGAALGLLAWAFHASWKAGHVGYWRSVVRGLPFLHRP
ncbi:hypothetical protein [Nocardiopsis chromatogenes]|uniref:hypothetical protein n=1 Tax=Nocardiopsis chromatogenes TaxID=280239 RepID=UPI000347D304|nr:hypothetical protein [Nocardiopsis chromatogenes]